MEKIDNTIIEEMAYPSGWNLDEFERIRSFAGKARYCEMYLQRIASGTGRIVYKVDDNKALKLAKNQKGIEQNRVEAGDAYRNRAYDIFAGIYEAADDYSWIEMQLARKATPADFKKFTGYPFKVMQAWVCYCQSSYISG